MICGFDITTKSNALVSDWKRQNKTHAPHPLPHAVASGTTNKQCTQKKRSSIATTATGFASLIFPASPKNPSSAPAVKNGGKKAPTKKKKTPLYASTIHSLEDFYMLLPAPNHGVCPGLLLALLRLQVLVGAEREGRADEDEGVEADARGGAVGVGDRGVGLRVRLGLWVALLLACQHVEFPHACAAAA